MKYYISRAGQQYGPYSLDDLKNMKAQGRVDANDLAWGEGMASWSPLSQVLGAEAPAAAPQPQAQQQPQYAAAQQQPYAAAQPQSYPQAQPQQPYTPPQQSYAPAQQSYTPQPQYAQQGGVYGAAAAAPAYSGAAYSPAYAQPAATGLMPPNLHWALVWLIGAVTGGIFIYVWAFMEASFVKKLDPQSKGTKYLVMYLVAVPGAFIVYMLLLFAAMSSRSTALMALGGLVFFAGIAIGTVFAILAFFNMRASLLNYYNSVEPIGLRLSGVMTFFFNILYFQYHFSRIAAWKQTGRLS